MAPTRCGYSRLPTEVILQIARDHLNTARDILALGKANRFSWNAVKTELFIHDIESCRRHSKQIMDFNGRPIGQDYGPVGVPFTPALPWLIDNDFTEIALRLMDMADQRFPLYLNMMENDCQHIVHIAAAHGNLPVIERFMASSVCEIEVPLLEPINRRRTRSRLPCRAFDFRRLLHRTCVKNQCVVDALGIAIMCNQEPTVKLLLQQEGLLQNFKDDVVCSNLHLAALHGNLPVVEALLKELPHLNGVPNDPDLNRASPLHVAVARRENKDVMDAIVQGMVKAGYDLPSLLNARDAAGRSPIFWAAMHNNPDRCLYLLQNPVKIFFRDLGGCTILDYTCRSDDLLIFSQAIMDRYRLRGKDILIQNAFGHAIDSGGRSYRTIQYLLSEVPSLIEFKWPQGWNRGLSWKSFHDALPPNSNVLHAAMQTRNYSHEVLELFLSHPKSAELINSSDGDSRRPISYTKRRPQATLAFIKAGARCDELPPYFKQRIPKLCKRNGVPIPPLKARERTATTSGEKENSTQEESSAQAESSA
ncbi:ankyrin [Xylariaceae sp. AK1471]|nr:ankyrin [Xylariaceae sp. AK1471]